jgi:hypothetical protein
MKTLLSYSVVTVLLCASFCISVVHVQASSASASVSLSALSTRRSKSQSQSQSQLEDLAPVYVPSQEAYSCCVSEIPTAIKGSFNAAVGSGGTLQPQNNMSPNPVILSCKRSKQCEQTWGIPMGGVFPKATSELWNHKQVIENEMIPEELYDGKVMFAKCEKGQFEGLVFVAKEEERRVLLDYKGNCEGCSC